VRFQYNVWFRFQYINLTALQFWVYTDLLALINKILKYKHSLSSSLPPTTVERKSTIRNWKDAGPLCEHLKHKELTKFSSQYEKSQGSQFFLT
jgi:hypothetical protein